MLDADTKRRIDTARDILVGKVPDPKSQVEQITIALIYKFMDDMDAESEEFGGKRNFFAGDFARYGWAKLMRSGLGGYETLNLYAEAITKMPENPGIPLLFRDIFKNAYLPYRDPETLKMFLKVIDEFTYDHSERLGDAFEYLLSVLGSQGDAGQFRTPRHIIDFMVKIIDPQKDEVVLDPACGTAGFLISSYKHILRANTDEKGNSTLTPDDKGRLAQYFRGYDISPDMVRLSLVNLYLHGFADPHIYEYDTLSSQERWNETADVILANPPFMSPKGGIQPHNRFTVQSKRSEVLFVDYMAEHLTPNGRAGIIVPEGIIFQSGKAYVQLRRMLVESALVAVISLPAGVFNPYSGVKTSILILDKALAKKASTVAFFKVENDGFGLGAQRREIEQNDLPQVLLEMQEYLQKLRAGETVEELKPDLGMMVAREKLAANGEYNLSGERYREDSSRISNFPIIPLGEVAHIIAGQSPPGESYNDNGSGVPFYQGKTEFGDIYIKEPVKWTTDPQRFSEIGDILMSVRAPVGPVNFTAQRICIGRGLAAIRPDQSRLLSSYTFYILRSMEQEINGDSGAVFASITSKGIADILIPLPPLDVQREIVAEIESYQKVIDGARAVVENYKPRIAIDPDWPMVELGEVAELINGRAYKQEELLDEGKTPVLRVGNFFSNRDWYYSDLELDEDKYCVEGDLLFAWSASFGPRIWKGPRVIFHYHIWKVVTSDLIDKHFLYYLLEEESEKIKSEGNGIAMMHATKKGMEKRKFPLPPIDIQLSIAKELESEKKLIEANRELITRFEKKIQMVLERVWGKQEKDQE